MDRETAMEEEEGKTSSPLLCASSSVAMSNPKFANASQMCGGWVPHPCDRDGEGGRRHEISSQQKSRFRYCTHGYGGALCQDSECELLSKVFFSISSTRILTGVIKESERSICNPCSFSRNDQQI